MHHRIYLLITLMALLGCSYRDEKKSSTEPLKGRTWFQKIQSGIFQPKCLSCHSSMQTAGGIDLSSYAEMIKKQIVIPFEPEKSSLYHSIKTGKMPRGGEKLSESDVQMVYDWISQGAKEFDADTPIQPPQPPAPPPNKPQAKFSWLVANTFRNKCIRCHSGAHPKADVDFSSYNNLMNSEGIKMVPVRPRNPEESGIYLEIKNGNMPPPPGNCSAEELQAIYDWIMAGAENN